MEKIKPCEVQFVNEKLQSAYVEIGDRQLRKFIDRAI